MESRVAGRFWAKVAIGPGCWLWTGARTRGSYGNFWDGEHYKRAHRMAWEMLRGPIPDGLSALHRCDTPPCVRIDHLFIGSTADNVHDSIEKGRFRTGVSLGTANGNSKHSSETVARVRDLHDGGMSVKAISTLLDLPLSTTDALAFRRMRRRG